MYCINGDRPLSLRYVLKGKKHLREKHKIQDNLPLRFKYRKRNSRSLRVQEIRTSERDRRTTDHWNIKLFHAKKKMCVQTEFKFFTKNINNRNNGGQEHREEEGIFTPCGYFLTLLY